MIGDEQMGKSITEKILEAHLLEGEMVVGKEIGIRVDQTLTQDATGTMAYLAFEALELSKTKTEVSVSYVDHNTLQTGFENADDHLYLQTIAKKYGIYYSRPGNGICHSVHYQRFAKPGKTLLGSDSHTPTSGALGMIAIGAGGMSVATSMAGEPFYLKMPKVVNVYLTGKLSPGVASKDIILELLRRQNVKGGLGRVMEYTGPGVQSLSIPQRATITNMGAELGATTSIFQSDQVTYEFLKAQEREEDWIELLPDEDVVYDEVIQINLNELKPMAAKPHMPDKVSSTKELSHIKVDQVFIGSCTNASYSDIAKAAAILEGKSVHPDVSLCVAPGSKQVFEMITRDGILQKLISSGARILESACGPCVGVGQAPNTGGVSVRTSNRNFIGRSGTSDAKVYLASPEVAAATAITGYITDPREIVDGEILKNIEEPDTYIIDDRMIEAPADNGEKVEIKRGPNIQPIPMREKPEEILNVEVILKVEDNITTDDIMPAGAKILPLRSNISAISEYVYKGIDPNFSQRAKVLGKSIIIGGENYGQGSSREHAALAPMYLGLRAVIAKSIARIHKDNLINYGILPLVFKNKDDYGKVSQGDILIIDKVRQKIITGEVLVKNETTGEEIPAVLEVSDRQKQLLIAGGLLNFIKEKNA